jgi:site-specific DNA-methyltransferase (adenine-specific)
MPVSEVRLCDCMEMMKEYKDNFFDLAIVDPPYGIGHDIIANKGGGTKHGRAVAPKQKYNATNWDNSIPDFKYFNELRRVSKNQIIWGYNYFSNLLPQTNAVIVWDKKCHEKYSTDMSDGEIAWNSIGNRTAIFRYLWSGMMQGSEADGTRFIGDLSKKEIRIHPTQKPVALYKWILKNYANEGNKILDTHLGSGSHRIAAYIMGFDFYACENDVNIFEAQEKRFKEQTAQQRLFL